MQIGSGIVFILGAIVLWPLSFWVFRALFYIPLAAVALGNAGRLSLYLAWAGMSLLVVEGCRCTRPLFDLKDFSQSVYYQNPVAGTASGALPAARCSASAIPWRSPTWFRSFFSAPRTSVLAVKALRSVIRAAPEAFGQAARLTPLWRSSDGGFRLRKFRHCMAGVMLLDRLGLIWTEVKEGEMQLGSRRAAGRFLRSLAGGLAVLSVS